MAVIFGHTLREGEPMPELGSLRVTHIDDMGVYSFAGKLEDVDKLPTDWPEMESGSLFIAWSDGGTAYAYEKTSQQWYPV